MKLKIANTLTVLILSISSVLSAQTYSEGFDTYESGAGGAFGQGLSNHSDVPSKIDSITTNCMFISSQDTAKHYSKVFFFTTGAGIGYSYRKLYSSKSFNQYLITEYNAREKADLGFSLTVGMTYELSSWVSFAVTPSYDVFNYSSKVQDTIFYYHAGTDPANSSGPLKAINSTYHYGINCFGLPLGIRFHFLKNEKSNFFFGAATGPGYIQEHYYIIGNDNKRAEELDPMGKVKSWSILIAAECGGCYLIGNNISIGGNLFFKTSWVNSVYSSYIDKRIYIAGVSLSCNVKI